MTTTEVLISGAGPTGLMLAAELARRNVRFRIFDKVPERPSTSRALVVQARTLELFQKLGIDQQLIERGRTAMQIALFVQKKQAIELEFGDIGVDDTPFPYVLFLSQVETERALDGWLRERGIVVERSMELTGYEETPDGITATVLRGGNEERVETQYLVGCDGAHSAVRHATGLRFEGAAYPQDFILADVRLDWDRRDDELALFFARKGFLAVFPFGENNLYRLIGSRASASADDPDPTLAEFEQLFADVTPFHPRLYDSVWLARFRLHHRGVERYRKGRVFLAGDAAHVHSPAGGQGMNTGIQDAENLAWKLALALRGRGGDALLDSYDAERRPVGRTLLRATDRMFSLATSRMFGVPTLRNLIVPRVVPLVLNDRDRRRRAFRFVSELAIAYDDSPIVGEDDGGADAAFARGPHAGDRAPDAPFVTSAGTTTLFAAMRGPQHHLLVFPAEGESQPPADANDDLDVIAVAASSTVARERYGVTTAACYLVRPDGYVAYRSHGSDPARALAFFAKSA